jgi:hypothetical protein
MCKENATIGFTDEELVGEIHRQIKLIEQVGSNLRMLCLVIENKVSNEGQNNTIDPPTETETVMETVMEIMNPTEPLVLQVIPREDFVMAVVLEQVEQSILTGILNQNGFASVYDVTPDKFQTVIDTIRREKNA